MTKNTINQRLGISSSGFLDGDFPIKARTALAYLFVDIDDKGYCTERSKILLELNRIGRFTEEDIDCAVSKPFFDQVLARLVKLSWYQVLFFCERVYSKFLREIGSECDYCYTSLSEVREYYTDEINLIMDEENFAFQFVDGQFQRRGRAQTQKVIERLGFVLGDYRLEKVKKHYLKARKFFNNRPKPDCENCIKEALCALEASLEILTEKNASLEFDKSIKQIEGNEQRQIPYPIGDAMIKLHSYRGSGQGVAHASINGNRVNAIDAELVLSIVASFITYLVDLLPFEEELPF